MTPRNIGYTAGEVRAIISPLIDLDDPGEIITFVIIVAVKDPASERGYMVRCMGDSLRSDFTTAIVSDIAHGLIHQSHKIFDSPPPGGIEHD